MRAVWSSRRDMGQTRTGPISNEEKGVGAEWDKSTHALDLINKSPRA